LHAKRGHLVLLQQKPLKKTTIRTDKPMPF
jgi:hypothetical protein